VPVNWMETPLGQSLFAAADTPRRVQASDNPPKTANKSPRGAFSQRMYANAVPSRTNNGFASWNSSADSELVSSLANLRTRSRQLIRDAGYAKNARRVIINNVIGTGVRLQSLVANTRGGLNQRVNDSIEDTWKDWCAADSCHTGGKLHFADMERMLIGETMEAGEIFIRMHRRPFGASAIPLSLEVIEPERIVDGYAVPSAISGDGMVRMGVEVDKFRRPVAYWVRDLHPGDIRLTGDKTDRAERVPAADMFHMHIVDRWPQTRGEPWLHAVAGKLLDMNGYSEAEIIGARGAANYLATIETPEDSSTLGDEQSDGSMQAPLEPGTQLRLLPGEKMNFISPNRPNSAMDPFMRFMLREVAAGAGVSYESLSRDYSQGNYSSTRLALLDDRDVWRALQQWYIRSFRMRLHTEWMTAAMLASAVPALDAKTYFQNPKAMGAAFFRPRGWSWVDPTKEVAAFKEAVKAGFTTVGDVIASTSGGSDLEDVLRTREDELEYMDDLNLYFDTSPEVYIPAETRGQMLLTPDGIEPAAAIVPPAQPGEPGAVDASGKPIVPDKPAAPATSETEDTEAEEPEGAEVEEGDRAMRMRRTNHLRIING
jgi:lambda family phage portal protein